MQKKCFQFIIASIFIATNPLAADFDQGARSPTAFHERDPFFRPVVDQPCDPTAEDTIPCEGQSIHNTNDPNLEERDDEHHHHHHHHHHHVHKDHHSEDSDEEAFVCGSYSNFTIQHQRGYHQPIHVTPGGDHVTIEDGSVWQISQDDMYKTREWCFGEPVLIYPNYSWFSSYAFIFFNIKRGDFVKTNMSLTPLLDGECGLYRMYIYSIDYVNQIVTLNDFSVWQISSFDRGAFLNWIPGDTVIIGVNTMWIANPHILFNTTRRNIANCNCK